MSWDQWPQWVTFFWLVLPAVTWPAHKLIKEEKLTAEWAKKYIGRLISCAVIGLVLYQGGFWA